MKWAEEPSKPSPNTSSMGGEWIFTQPNSPIIQDTYRQPLCWKSYNEKSIYYSNFMYNISNNVYQTVFILSLLAIPPYYP